jgi:hypothetical protein
MKLPLLAVVGMLAVVVNAQTNDYLTVSTAGWYQVTQSNIYLINTNGPTTLYYGNWSERLADMKQTTNAINDLAASGDICRVKGHCWRDGRPGEGNGFGFADLHPGTTYRTCKICGWCESKTEGSWK